MVVGPDLTGDTFVVIDVQCGATGPSCADRYPLRVQAIKMAREEGRRGSFEENREFSAFVMGPSPLASKIDWKSMLTPITGITREEYAHATNKQTLDQVVAHIFKYVPQNATMVCQADWGRAEMMLAEIGLRKMVNFDQFVSLGEIFTTDCLPEDEGVPKGRTFNLAVLVKAILGREPQADNRARDLTDLFKRADALMYEGGTKLADAVRKCIRVADAKLDSGERSYAHAHDDFEGVCLGHMHPTPFGKACHCGANLKPKPLPSSMVLWW
ncbi:Exonuclease domain-containing protein [Plasmodiophora brassicae]